GSLPAITRAMRAARQGLQSVLPVRAGLEPLSRGLSSYTMRQHSALSQLCEDPVCSRTLSINRSCKSLLDKGWFVARLRTDFSPLSLPKYSGKQLSKIVFFLCYFLLVFKQFQCLSA